jgi:16S rRNA (cytosine967-C5)-methyltransferase
MTISFPVTSLAFAFFHAADIVARVMAGESLADGHLKTVPAVARPQTQDMVYGALRRHGQGEALLAQLARNQPRPPITALLLVAFYRLEGRADTHTVVNQAVAAASAWEGGRYKGLVNGVLRNFLRQRAMLVAALPEAARCCHPAWWLTRLQHTYPDDWPRITDMGNQLPPMTLRVNLRRTTQDACAERLLAAGFPATPLGETGLLLDKPVAVEKLPGFADGDWSVQDWGAQRAAALLAPKAGSRVLDACAAPGGKTAHLLESFDGIRLVAEDIAPTRCQRLTDNLTRLGLSADIRVADARWMSAHDEATFDAILADVPCSASGVARRFPDIKWLRKESDIAHFAHTQGQILRTLWRRLSVGGKLLYATCSVFPPENEEQISRFLAKTPDAILTTEEHWLPDHRHDGFYYALLQKHA